MKIAEKILEERNKNKGNAEYLISYGNLHKLLHDQNGENKHEWTAFVNLKNGKNTLKNCIDKLKDKANLAIYFEKYQNIEVQEKDKIIDLQRESKVIKQVIFSLHPTFNPSKLVLGKPPFEVRRIGWGTFNIPIKIMFNEKLGLEPLELNFDLSFSRSLNEHFKTLYIDFDKLV
jgi:transcription initiation factor IIF auxiliary subunit